MATPRERFVEALKALKKVQDDGVIAVSVSDLPNKSQRALLAKHGFLIEVLKGWYIPADPGEKKGDSTAWLGSYWDFCSRFLEQKYGDNWVISPEQSLLIHAGNRTVPTQLIVRSPNANNTVTPFPHNTSLFNLKGELPDPGLRIIQNGIRMYTLQASLIYSSASIFTRNPIDSRTTLSMIRDSSELLPVLLEKGHTTIAGRLAGAFRNIAREKIADGIIDTMKGADYAIRESDPFEYQLQVNLSSRERSPAVNRIKFLWQEMREVVCSKFPKAPGLPEDVSNYLQRVDDIYVTDAYHSLSIERYRVTPELIERVSSGKWDKDGNEADKKQRDAMAARGYWLAFQKVKESISKILDGANSGSVVGKDHAKWFTELFDPSVAAGILKLSDLAGYRSSQVYIGGSKHTPLHVDAMRDTMPVLFELLENEPEAVVRAVLGHFIFVFIHPYMDGNGRMGRFLMNAMLASGGYPWTVIPVGKREQYMTTLEKASADNDIGPFAAFIGELVLRSMEGHPEANLEGMDQLLYPYQ